MIPDVVVSSPRAITRDWLLTPVHLREPSAALVDAVVIALGSDRLALPDDDLPNPGDTDRRGWWGDLDAQEIWDGWPVGSRLWLLGRTGITDQAARKGSTLARAETYVREALQPFVERGIASRVAAKAERIGLQRIDVAATLYRGPLPAIQLRFADLWQGIRA